HDPGRHEGAPEASEECDAGRPKNRPCNGARPFHRCLISMRGQSGDSPSFEAAEGRCAWNGTGGSLLDVMGARPENIRAPRPKTFPSPAEYGPKPPATGLSAGR